MEESDVCSSWGHKELDMTSGLNNNKISEECHKSEKERKCINIFSIVIIYPFSIYYFN